MPPMGLLGALSRGGMPPGRGPIAPPYDIGPPGTGKPPRGMPGMGGSPVPPVMPPSLPRPMPSPPESAPPALPRPNPIQGNEYMSPWGNVPRWAYDEWGHLQRSNPQRFQQLIQALVAKRGGSGMPGPQQPIPGGGF